MPKVKNNRLSHYYDKGLILKNVIKVTWRLTKPSLSLVDSLIDNEEGIVYI